MEVVPALGWNVGALVVFQRFESSCGRGQQTLRAARALFQRFGLGESQDPRAWFFCHLPDGSGFSSTVSEVKWKIWIALAMSFLECTVPDYTVRFLIALTYCAPKGQSKLEDTSPKTIWGTPDCHYTGEKIKKVLEKEALGEEDELIANAAKVVERLPAPQEPRRVSDALQLFSVTPMVLDVAFAWVFLQVNNKSLEWLADFENQAAARHREGRSNHVDKVLLFLLDTVCSFTLAPPEKLAGYQSCSGDLSKIKWKGMNLSPGMHQMLQELLPVPVPPTTGLADLQHWIRDHSHVYRKRLFRGTTNVFRRRNKSLMIGRLLYSWTKTHKGLIDYKELLHLSNSSGDDFVQHVKYTLERSGDQNNDECQALYRAAGAVFGEEFSGRFVTLCARVQWDKDTAVVLQVQELEKIQNMVKKGVFCVAYPLPEQEVLNTWLNDMILYLTMLVLENHLQCINHLDTWKADAKVLLISRCCRADIMGNINGKDKFSQGIYFIDIATEFYCRRFEAWLHSPSTAKELGTSVEAMDDALRKAVAEEEDEASKALLSKMAVRLGYSKIEMYGSAYAYVTHWLRKSATEKKDHSFAGVKRLRKEDYHFGNPFTRRSVERERWKRCKRHGCRM